MSASSDFTAFGALSQYVQQVIDEVAAKDGKPISTMLISVAITEEMLRRPEGHDPRPYAVTGLYKLLQRAHDYRGVVEENTTQPGPLNHDHDIARSVHRVIRAMHDGECPKCHNLHPSTAMVDELQSGHRCPSCGFTISAGESGRGLALFRTFMEKNLAVFETWRDQSNAELLVALASCCRHDRIVPRSADGRRWNECNDCGTCFPAETAPSTAEHEAE